MTQRKVKGYTFHKRFKKSNPFAGLRFGGRTGIEGLRYRIISRHWPHLLCWSWGLYIEFYRPRLSKYCWKSFVRMRNNGGLRAYLRFGCGAISFHKQNYDWMLKDNFLYEATEQ